MALGLLAGLVLGSGGALVADRRSGRVYALDELQVLLKAAPLARLHLSDAEAATTTMALLAQHHLQGCSSLALVPVGLNSTDGRLEQLQEQAGLAHLQWETRVEQTPDVTALVMTSIASWPIARAPMVHTWLEGS